MEIYVFKVLELPTVWGTSAAFRSRACGGGMRMVASPDGVKKKPAQAQGCPAVVQ